jgi:hypothetical protein
VNEMSICVRHFPRDIGVIWQRPMALVCRDGTGVGAARWESEIYNIVLSKNLEMDEMGPIHSQGMCIVAGPARTRRYRQK